MKKRTISMLLMAGMALSMTAMTASAETVVKYSVTYPSTGTQADGANRLAELIDECSEGRMKMEFYPSSQLGDKAATLEGMAMALIYFV